MDTLKGFIGNIGSLAGNVNPTGAVANAFNSIQANAGNVPDYTNQALGYASNLIGGGNNYAPMVQDAYGKRMRSTRSCRRRSIRPRRRASGSSSPPHSKTSPTASMDSSLPPVAI
jgi:hypothetical protein